MKANKPLQVILSSLVLLALVGTSWHTVFASQMADKVLDTEEVELDLGKDYDISIGNGGVFFAESAYQGTAVLKKIEHPENFGLSWRVWTQNQLEIRVYDPQGSEFQRVYGLVQIYFDLDILQRQYWEEKNNMSIWYRDEFKGWVKCPTFMVFSKDAPKGRLMCWARGFGLYGLAYTQPSMEIKMLKHITPTLTPTLTPTVTPTP